VRVIDQRLISKIDAGVRYLSCGYKYHLAKMGDRLLQVDIRGNHVAVVPKGRAGPAARLADAAPQTEKEKHPVKKNKDYFIGLGLSQFAKDAPPEEVAAAVKELAFDSAAESSKKDDKSDEKSSGKDSGSKGKDAGGSDYRDRMHKAVDMLCDKRDAMANSGEADIAELHNLLSGAPALDADKDDEDDEKSKGKDAKAEDADAEDEDMSEAEDDGASVIEPFSEEEKPENPSAATDSALEVLKRLRPAIARSKDPRLKGAFDSELKRLQPAVRSGDKGKGGYGGFAQAAAVSTGKDSDPFSGQPESPLMKQKRETDEAYAKSRAAKRGEVK